MEKGVPAKEYAKFSGLDGDAAAWIACHKKFIASRPKQLQHLAEDASRFEAQRWATEESVNDVLSAFDVSSALWASVLLHEIRLEILPAMTKVMRVVLLAGSLTLAPPLIA